MAGVLRFPAYSCIHLIAMKNHVSLARPCNSIPKAGRHVLMLASLLTDKALSLSQAQLRVASECRTICVVYLCLEVPTDNAHLEILLSQ